MQAWRQFLAKLEKELGISTDKWIPKLLRFDAANVYLDEPDSFQLAWFTEHVKPRLFSFTNNNGRPIKVHLGVKSAPAQVLPPTFTIKDDPLDPELTFENFVPQEANLVVYKLLTELPPFNPIYIYGPPKSGKTHLLTATAHAAKAKGKKVFFVKAETFTEHVVQAIRLGQMQIFRNTYRDIDVLIIDNIDVFSKKLATQEEFFHTFNTLHMVGKLILLSASTAPTNLHDIEERLISRFEWGISLDLKPPDILPILKQKVKIWNLSYDPALFPFLMQNFPNPITALQLLALRTKASPLTATLAAVLLKDILSQTPALTPEQIIKAIAAHFGIKSEDLLGKSQQREFVLPRQIAMHYCRDKLKLPYQHIGKIFSRDHSTVMSSIKLAAKHLPANLTF